MSAEGSKVTSVQSVEPILGLRELSDKPPGGPWPARGLQRAPKILLLDAYSTRTLACVRSWGKRGISFVVGGESKLDMSLHSRYTAEKFVYTSPKVDGTLFLDDVNRQIGKYEADFVFPTSEAGIMVCAQNRKQLACTPLVPEDREIDLVFSKAKTLEIARSVEIPVPRTLHITNETVESIYEPDLQFPVAVKSESSEVMLASRAATSGKTSYMSTIQELERECRSRLSKGQSVLVQEFIDGYGIGISGLFQKGQAVATIAHRRVRESDPLGGPSALAETIAMDSELLELTKLLFKTINFTGPAMAEYRVDRRTGKPYFMEINGRFWGTILLAPAAGLDLPYLYWKMINGEAIKKEETLYRTGIRGRYLIGDTKCLLLCLKGRPANWPGDFATRGDALSSYCRSFFDPNTKDLLFTSDDPKPFFAKLAQDLAKA